MIPNLFWSKYYHESQEDASEFLMRVLNAETGSPTLAPLFAGRDKPTLACANPRCSYQRDAAEEKFNTIIVQIRNEDGQPVQDVQEAVAAYMLPETQEASFHWHCPSCGSTAPPRKEHHVDQTPVILLVQLCRWQTAHAEGAILDAVHVNERIDFQGVSYRLSSSIMHQGTNPNSGHYLTCARHETADNAWFYYNDERRRFASPGERESTKDDKSYILFYERLDEQLRH